MSMMRSHILEPVVSQKHKNLDISRAKDREEVLYAKTSSTMFCVVDKNTNSFQRV